MLVLGRKVGSRIKINDDIEVVVVKITRGGVRLGVVAPSHVRVRRSELENGKKCLTKRPKKE